MNGWQELVSNIVTSAIWPVVVLILGVIFRDTLSALLGRLKGFEGLGAKLELGESVKQVDSAADSVGIEDAKRQAAEGDGSGGKQAEAYVALSHLIEVAHLSPSAAIVEAWREVEQRLFTYWATARKFNLVEDIKSPNPNELLRALVRAEQLTDQQQMLLKSLQVTRNKVAHSVEKPTEGQALTYVEAAGQALRSLARDTFALEKGEF